MTQIRVNFCWHGKRNSTERRRREGSTVCQCLFFSISNSFSHQLTTVLVSVGLLWRWRERGHGGGAAAQPTSSYQEFSFLEGKTIRKKFCVISLLLRWFLSLSLSHTHTHARTLSLSSRFLIVIPTIIHFTSLSLYSVCSIPIFRMHQLSLPPPFLPLYFPFQLRYSEFKPGQTFALSASVISLSIPITISLSRFVLNI